MVEAAAEKTAAGGGLSPGCLAREASEHSPTFLSSPETQWHPQGVRLQKHVVEEPPV